MKKKKLHIIIEEELEDTWIEVDIDSIKNLLDHLDLKIENYIVIKNGRVVTDLNEKLSSGDEIKIIEAVGGG